MPSASSPLPAAVAVAVLARTAAAWNIKPDSPRAVARRAPHGYVPARALRRLRAGVPALAHSW